MSSIVHERPGVYSSYDASMLVRRGTASKVVGVAALAAQGDTDQTALVTSYESGLALFGADGEGESMAEILRLLFLNGVTAVRAVRVADSDSYADAFDLLSMEEDIQVVVCDSGELTVQQLLRTSLESASAARRERIGVVGSSGESVSALITRAEGLNSERMVLVGPDVTDGEGNALSGVFAAAAVAGAIAANSDPAAPINGVALSGLGGVGTRYNDNDIDLLVRGGVTPLEAVGGVMPRTKTGGSADATWRELTTILIVDDVIPPVRAALRSRFTRTKNTLQTRGAIRSQVIVELENKVAAQIIDGYGEVSVEADSVDPTVCLVEFSFAVAHGLNQIYLTAHITV